MDRSTTLERRDGCWRGTFRAMASPCELLVRHASESLARRLLEAVANEAWRIEDKFSRYRSDNIIARINNGAGEPVQVDDETARLIDFAVTLHELSDGGFDITSGALRKAWNFDGSDRVPDAQTVRAALADVGWHKVDWNRPWLTLRTGMQIDLGGIGKEYAVDRAATRVAELTDCCCLVNFGGDLAASGAQAAEPPWQVGVESPDGEGRQAERLIRLGRGALATSGDARRFLLKDGTRYSHILNPLTGWPVSAAPRSVTVAANTCTQAGMLATLAMLKGPDAEAFLDAQGVQYWCRR